MGEPIPLKKERPMPARPEPPIKSLTSIDMIGKRKDGGVDLGIIVSRRLRSSVEHQKLLMDKVEAYLGAINSEKFKREFDNPPPRKTRILIKCLVPPDPVIIELVRRMEQWVKDNNARIKLEVEELPAPKGK